MTNAALIPIDLVRERTLSVALQGDGEGSFCGAIEMSGWLDLKWALSIDAMSPAKPMFLLQSLHRAVTWRSCYGSTLKCMQCARGEWLS